MNLRFKALAFVATFGILFSACETIDTNPTPTVQSPTVEFLTGTNIISADASVPANSEFKVSLKATKTSNSLKALTIQEGSSTLSYDRIKINGTAASSNPILLFGTDKEGFTYEITIKAQSDASTKAFSFIVEDDAGNKTTKQLNITSNAVPPTVALLTGDSLNVAPSTIISNRFTVTAGSSLLKQIEIKENGTTITTLNRMSYQTLTNVFTANPYPIPTADKSKMDNVAILLETPATAGRYVYTFTFEDEAGSKVEKKLVAIVGTNVEVIVGALLNAAGPDGTGGLDLDTGKGTGSASTSAEIRDEGIDIGKPLATNWLQQISGINGSEVKYIVEGQNGVTGFNFENVKSKEEIASLFNKGVAFTKKIATRLVSNKINIGDVLVVKNGTKYYLLYIKDIKIDTNDNTDQYTIDIKK